MKNQITRILPRSEWEKVVIHETTQPLVEVGTTNRLKIALVEKRYTPSFFLRKAVALKHHKVAERLPKGINLVLIEGWRSMQAQQISWDNLFDKFKKENSTWSDEKIEQQVRLVVAKPSPLANHHCGGASDVTLAYDDGTLLDMGTPYPSEAMSADWHQKFKMFSEEITDEQKANRAILRDAMETEDFVWYPGE